MVMLSKPRDLWVHITIGAATPYAFKLLGGVHVWPKPFTGEALRTVGTLARGDQFDAPLVIQNFTGEGVSKADAFQFDADNRFWDGKNLQFRNGMWCLAPLAVAATDMAGTHNIIGFWSGIGAWFYYSNTNAASRETIAFWTGSSTTWTSATATVDFETVATGTPGFPCVGMANFIITNGVVMALRSQAVETGAARYQLIHSNDKTTWTVPDHGATANTPAGTLLNANVCVGLISWFNGATLTAATLSYNATTKVATLRTATNPAGTWADATGGTLHSSAAPTALKALPDVNGVIRPFVFTQEGVWYWDTAKLVPVQSFADDPSVYNGNTPVSWQIDQVPNGLNVYQQRRHIFAQNWPSTVSGTVSTNIAPTWQTQGLPTFRDGPVTAIATAPNFLWAAIGGDTANTTAGIHERVGQYLHPRGWMGTIYDLGTANRLITAMGYSASDDAIPRLHWAEQTGAAGATVPKFMANVTREPRTVTSYAHTATGTLIMPINSRGLDEVAGILRKIMFIGTGFTANNNISAVYVSVDAAPLDSTGAWGTTLGAVTTSGGSVNAPATPAGTGQAGKAFQIRIDLVGTSNNSPYITAVLLYIKKKLATKFIRVFTIDVAGSVSGLRSMERVLSDLKACQDPATDWSVTYGQESGLIMEPFAESKALEYVNLLTRSGSVAAQTQIETATLIASDV